MPVVTCPKRAMRFAAEAPSRPAPARQRSASIAAEATRPMALPAHCQARGFLPKRRYGARSPGNLEAWHVPPSAPFSGARCGSVLWVGGGAFPFSRLPFPLLGGWWELNHVNTQSPNHGMGGWGTLPTDGSTAIPSRGHATAGNRETCGRPATARPPELRRMLPPPRGECSSGHSWATTATHELQPAFMSWNGRPWGWRAVGEH